MTEKNTKLISAMWDSRYNDTRLSQDAKVSLPTIYRLKNNKLKKPQYDTLKRIADCLGKQVEEIF